MKYAPAPELDAETIEAAAARVAKMNLSADKPSFAEDAHAIQEQAKGLPLLEIPEVTEIFLAQAAERHPELAPPEPPNRKPRSDKGTKRTPKAETLSIEALSVMSVEQSQELIRLVAHRNETPKNWEDATNEALKCAEDFKLDAQALRDFIEALAVTK